MPCRVGITTNPNTRKSYWQSQVAGFKNWKILAILYTKEEAQGYETRYARRSGYVANADSPDTHGRWYVYRFDYTRSI